MLFRAIQGILLKANIRARPTKTTTVNLITLFKVYVKLLKLKPIASTLYLLEYVNPRALLQNKLCYIMQTVTLYSQSIQLHNVDS